jgi:hypothetical protein
MSYSRWSNSAWYSFYNVNGKLSLWYDMDNIIDWTEGELLELMSLEQGEIVRTLMETYGCPESEAIEAIEYIEMFLEDYDPEIGEEYNKEMTEFIAMLEDKKDES